MKKNGFVFIETIIVVVFLSASLLLLYNSYSSAILKEKDRLYYDDVAYIYRTNFVRKFLENNSNLDFVKQFSFLDTYVITIGSDFDALFTDEQKAKNYKSSLENIVANYHIHQMILLKNDYITKCYENNAICNNSKTGISYNMASYLKTLNDPTYEYYLVVEYAEALNSSGKFESCTPGIVSETTGPCIRYNADGKCVEREVFKCTTHYASLGI